MSLPRWLMGVFTHRGKGFEEMAKKYVFEVLEGAHAVNPQAGVYAHKGDVIESDDRLDKEYGWQKFKLVKENVPEVEAKEPEGKKAK